MNGRTLLAALATLGSFACTGSQQEPSVSIASPSSVSSPVQATPSGPTPSAPRPIQLGWLPPQGVLVQRNGGVVFVSLTGRRLAWVPGADLSSATQAPGRTTLEVDGALYALRTDLGALMPIPNGGPPVADDRRVPLPRPRMSDGRRLAGHWRFARLATDGNHILAQWSGECEVPLAYIIALQDGEPIPVTGAEEPPPESFALGWTRRSQAIVLLPNGACASSSGRPGVYAFSAPGVSRFITWVPDRIALARMWGAVGQPLPA